jgi:hypothetical protein
LLCLFSLHAREQLNIVKNRLHPWSKLLFYIAGKADVFPMGKQVVIREDVVNILLSNLVQSGSYGKQCLPVPAFPTSDQLD